VDEDIWLFWGDEGCSLPRSIQMKVSI